jgi:hypothetical protein
VKRVVEDIEREEPEGAALRVGESGDVVQAGDHGKHHRVGGGDDAQRVHVAK